MKGVIILADKGEKKTKVTIDGIVSKSALGTFTTAFDSYSNAKILEYDTIDPTSFAGTLQAGTYDSIEEKAIAIFRYTSGTLRKYMRLAIPAPDDDVLEFVDGRGYRILRAQGDAIAAMLRTLTGRSDLAFVRGKFFSRPTKIQGA
jgi:hypothetical protein